MSNRTPNKSLSFDWVTLSWLYMFCNQSFFFSYDFDSSHLHVREYKRDNNWFEIHRDHIFFHISLPTIQRKMHWSVLLVLCTLLLTLVIANPVNKHSLKHKKTKPTMPPKKPSTTDVAVKSNLDAFKFLTQFGYNRCGNHPGSNSDGDDGPSCQSSLESMLEDFQTFFHLPITKKLDAATLKLMNTARCSLSDIPSSLVDRSKLW